FSHNRAIDGPDQLEEERRLAYVGITRAQALLYLTHAWSRSLWGGTNYNPQSRFVGEIPDDLIHVLRQAESPRKQTWNRRGNRAIGPAGERVVALVNRGDRVFH